MAERMPRLVYLAAKLGPEAVKVSRDLKRVIPHYELYEAVAKEGVNAAAITLDIPRAQIRRLYDRGRSRGDEASHEEFRLLVAQEILEDDLDVSIKDQLGLMAQLERWVHRREDDLVSIEEMSLEDIDPDTPGIPKFSTGFTPLDMSLIGGAYQGLLIVVAPPGTGKTSIMISIMEGIRRTYPDWTNLFFEMEIPRQLMAARMASVQRRTPFGPNDKLFTGSIPIEEIEKKIEEVAHDVDDKVVFIDGPDAMPGLGTEGRRMELGHIYRRLVKIKEHSRLVVVSSQPNRREQGSLKLSSLAESWEKAWYADMVIAVNSTGLGRMRLHCLKNRFGMKDGEVQFEYDLSDLSWTNPTMEDDEWE